MKKFLKFLFIAISAIYPILVFTFLVIWKDKFIDENGNNYGSRIMSLCVIILGFAYFFSSNGLKKDSDGKRRMDWKPIITSILFIVCGALCFITQKAIFIKLYPVFICATLLFVFGSSLLNPPCIIFRLATLTDKSIVGSSYEKQVYNYCKKVTIIWCAFFVLNGGIALCTIFINKIFPGLTEAQGTKIYSLYTSIISYCLIGLLYGIEFLIRLRVDKKMIKAWPITKFHAKSRKSNHIMCYEDRWSEKNYKTWNDFLTDTAKMRAYISSKEADQWIVHCEDYWYFLITLVSLLQCKKQVCLTQNIAENFMNEVRTNENEFLTDQKADSSSRPTFIPELIENLPAPSKEEIMTTPEIIGEETRIVLFTSGSTGKPKAVPQRMKEFEEDNAFIISKFGKEVNSRKLITTVSQHHIYGFLFGICLPFTMGVPFRRTRIEFPEEFEKLTDEDYVIIATPAFLKRTVEVEDKLNLKNPWIFTSGGAVSPELSVSTEKVFGFCPMEVYGSTETSGIAYRQQKKDGLVWTPFDNAKVWQGDDGCLRIISPYIKNPEGFATADLVEFTGEGQRFILKGRSDSIVKIEEKRISMTEVENRILETGLVNDVKVVALSNDVRQYLAAVIVLNEKGQEQFKEKEKFDINKYFHNFLMKYFENVVLPKKWRYVDQIPVDVQGKKHVQEIKAMFD